MLRRCLSAALVLFVLAGFGLAGSHTGLITAISKDKVTVKVGKKGDAKELEIKVSKDVKISKKTKDGDTEASVDQVTEAIEKSKNKGVFAKIETDGEGDKEVVTKITFGGGGKKKKDK
jgi:hypothetical protein